MSNNFVLKAFIQGSIIHSSPSQRGRSSEKRSFLHQTPSLALSWAWSCIPLWSHPPPSLCTIHPGQCLFAGSKLLSFVTGNWSSIPLGMFTFQALTITWSFAGFKPGKTGFTTGWEFTQNIIKRGKLEKVPSLSFN